MKKPSGYFLSLLTARPVFSLKAFFATVVETKSQGTSA